MNARERWQQEIGAITQRPKLQLPPDYRAPNTVETLIALLRVYSRDGRATITSVREELQCSRATVHERIHHLIDLNLADFGYTGQHGMAGTLRPLVWPAFYGVTDE